MPSQHCKSCGREAITSAVEDKRPFNSKRPQADFWQTDTNAVMFMLTTGFNKHFVYFQDTRDHQPCVDSQ